MTQKTLSHELGVSYSALNSFLNGKDIFKKK
ncbi:hypothetical protein [Metabacillus sp. 22489]